MSENECFEQIFVKIANDILTVNKIHATSTEY